MKTCSVDARKVMLVPKPVIGSDMEVRENFAGVDKSF
jgi:hypothetical protein